MSHSLPLAGLVAAVLLSPIGTSSRAAGTPAATGHVPVVESYLKAFSAGDAAALERFAAEHLSEKARHGMPPAQVARFELGFRRMVGGGLDFYRVRSDSAHEVVALTRTRDEFPLFVRLTWHFDPDHPELVTARDMQPDETPTEAVGGRLAPDALGRDLEPKLTRLAATDRFSGVVLIARNGKPVWQKAFGLADRDAKTPNRLDTRFRLGSMNKMFTAVAIAQLVQAGKLRFNDRLAELLPDYPNHEAAEKVTVHHLLTHTSGLGDIFGPEFDRKKESLHEIRDYLSLFASQPLRFEPGSRWDYSNAGFIVLGLIVEKASGESYYDYVRHHIYDVAGMKSSGSFPKTDKIPKLAVGYTRQGPDGPLVSNWDTLPWRGMSAGGGDSTAGDLLRFDRALRAHRLLNRQLTETVLTGKVEQQAGSERRYAYGFEELRQGGQRVVGHGGGAPGMNAQLDMCLDSGYTVVVLANLDPPVGQTVASYIRARLK